MIDELVMMRRAVERLPKSLGKVEALRALSELEQAVARVTVAAGRVGHEDTALLDWLERQQDVTWQTPEGQWTGGDGASLRDAIRRRMGNAGVIASEAPSKEACAKCSGTDEKPWCELTQSEWCGRSNPALVKPADGVDAAPKLDNLLKMVRHWVEAEGGDMDALLAWMYAPNGITGKPYDDWAPNPNDDQGTHSVKGTALAEFNECGGSEEVDPLERLRFFCSLVIKGQDWLDVEQFFDAVRAQLNNYFDTGHKPEPE